MLDFSIKSIIHDYEVKFIDNSVAILENEIRYGDVIIIDRKIKELYPEISSELSRKKDSNKADAILIARYFNDTQL